MYLLAVYMGIVLILGAISVWIRAKNQPEGIPMFRGRRELSKRNVYRGAILLAIIGVVYLTLGFLL